MSEFAEPWQLHGPSDLIRGYNGKALHITQRHRHRIVACVNAMAGIPDPAAFVKAHRELVEAVEAYRDCDGGEDTEQYWARLEQQLAACAQQEKPV